jgi:superfamily I DNA/RNA helicase
MDSRNDESVSRWRKEKEVIPHIMQLTQEQTTFINFARTNRTKHIAVVANAGSGKSTTIAKYVNDLEGVNVLICSFSKQACESIQPKLDWAKAETLHAACRRWILKTKNWRTINIDNRKYKNILKNLIAEKEDIFCDLSKYEQDQVLARVDFIREYGSVDKPDHYDPFAYTSYDQLDELSYKDDFECEMGSQQLFDDLARKILTVYNKPNVFDFTDLLCYVADPKNKIVFEQYKEFILDEAQDLSPLQVKVIKRFIGETGARFIMVGDPNQCIYGFMGADIQTFNSLIKFFDCETFELTECFRVPNTLLNLAREYVPSIRSNIQFDNGRVHVNDLVKPDFVRENETAFLFRTNSDLFTMFSEFYDLGLVPIINCTFNPWKAFYMAQHLKIYDVRQCNDELSPEWKFFNVNESGIIFRIFSEILGITTLKELASAIDSYLKDADAKKDNSNCKLILSTIHRAKGAEFDYVVLFMDRPKEFKHDTKNEDNNLFYVGVTRAKKGLKLQGDL